MFSNKSSFGFDGAEKAAKTKCILKGVFIYGSPKP